MSVIPTSATASSPARDLLSSAGSLVDLLDPRGMDASVFDQLRQGHPCRLAPYRVEAAQDHRLGRVVDDEVHTGGGLERPDVAPSRPMMRPFMSSLGSANTLTVDSAVCSKPPLDRDRDDLAGPLLLLLERVADLRTCDIATRFASAITAREMVPNLRDVMPAIFSS
jgi:hypothetical protein